MTQLTLQSQGLNYGKRFIQPHGASLPFRFVLPTDSPLGAGVRSELRADDLGSDSQGQSLLKKGAICPPSEQQADPIWETHTAIEGAIDSPIKRSQVKH